MSRKTETEAAPNWGSFTKAELIRTIKLQDKQKRALLKQVTSAKELADTLDTALRKERSEVEPLLEQARVKIDELRVQCDDTSLVAEALRKERDALRRERDHFDRLWQVAQSSLKMALDKRLIDAHMPEQVDDPSLPEFKRPW